MAVLKALGLVYKARMHMYIHGQMHIACINMLYAALVMHISRWTSPARFI